MKTYKQFLALREATNPHETSLIDNALKALAACKAVVQDDPRTEQTVDECMQALNAFKDTMGIRFNPRASSFTDF